MAALASVGAILGFLFLSLYPFLSFWNTLAVGMVAILWFGNFSGIFLPSLRLDLSGLGVGMPSQGPELSLDWLDPLSVLSLLLCLWSDLLFLVTGISCAHIFSVCLASPFFLSLMVCSSFQPSRFFSRVLFLVWRSFLGGVVLSCWGGVLVLFLSPSLKVVVFSLGSGRVHSTVFLEPFAFLFLYPLRSFRQLLGVILFG